MPDSTEQTSEGNVTLPGGLDLPTFQALMDAATAAGVDAKPALTAVTRFHNPLERVLKVLNDLRLAATEQAFRNVTGLFVRLMRSGEDVNLPMSVLAQQAAQKAQQTPAAPAAAPDTTAAAPDAPVAPVRAATPAADTSAPPTPKQTPAPAFMPDAGVAVRVMGDLGTAYRVVRHFLKNTVWMTCVEAAEGWDVDVETVKLRPEGFKLKLTPA
ncbi:hypothetical protein [Deinococcus kurensis]|uniref:hypothetical protein n=1 Tax=Deinococcus kurensis TaxID=2662757 RepID=UPI0012D360DC|nr:hypothetical protein [Deinococcus kurensis]